MLQLGQNFVVENEIIRILVIIDRFEGFPAVCAVTGVVFGEFLSEQDVLDQRQNPIRHIFIDRHSACNRILCQDSRRQAHIIHAGGDHRGHGRHEFGLILVIGMQHHHNIRPARQRDVVTTFLIRAISLVRLVADAMNAELLSQGEGVIRAMIIDQNHIMHHIHRDGGDRGTQGFRGVVCGKDDGEAQGEGLSRKV